MVVGCNSQNCNEIDLHKRGHNVAISTIRQFDFKFSEEVNTNESSWIKSVEYYSCDEVTGFLLITTKKGKEYIHNGVPKDLWSKFIHSNSFGSFYNSNIKGKYQY
jgi:hypothetical protein